MEEQDSKEALPSPPKKQRRLNARQMKFVRELARNPINQSEAVRRAGYSTSVPHVMGSQLVSKSNIRLALMQEMEKLNIPSTFTSNWNKILNLTVSDGADNLAVNANLVLKAQDQIARLAGLEPPKEVARTLTMTLDGLLPMGDSTHPDPEIPTLVLNPEENKVEEEKT